VEDGAMILSVFDVVSEAGGRDLMLLVTSAGMLFRY